ncbi:MAG: membrane protein insertase YidC [Rhodospirillales bacterium]
MDNKNLLMAIVLSVVILVGFEFYIQMTTPPVDPATQEQTAANKANPDAPQPTQLDAGAVPTPGAAPTAATAASGVANLSREDLLATEPRISIETPRLGGSISLVGGRIDDLKLHNYRETLDPSSNDIVLLHPKGAINAYHAGFGWVAGQGQKIRLPAPDTVWTADRASLGVNAPVTLSWDNGEGLIFRKTISVDANYMFDVVQSVENTTSNAVTLHSYGLVTRRTTPEVTGFFILHEGLLGVFDETLKEVDYDDLQDEGVIQQPTTGGWLGITDKYWLTALIPDQDAQLSTRFIHRLDNGADRYQTDFLSPAFTIQPGGEGSFQSRLFAGAKEVPLLDAYSEDLGIDRFDLAVDFGWFYFLTKPIFQALLWINTYVGNLGVAILLLTVAIKLVFFPLANKSYVAMSKMKKLQPEMVKLREQYGDDKMRLNQEMMALYKREKANPASGCLPILIQIPVFFALYKVLFVTIEMRHAPFFGWIQDLSAPDPTTIFNLFGLIPWTPPDFLMIGIWPLIMGASMYLQQKLNPQPADPMQAKIFLFLPILFTFLLAAFPAGLVIYWAWNNCLSILQQWIIMRRMGVAAGGGKVEESKS